jgi:hypothetical protein
MTSIFNGDERRFAPTMCDFWQLNRIPRSPLPPNIDFLRWLHTDSEENYKKSGNKQFSVESVGYHFNSLGYRGCEFEYKPGEAGVMFVGDSHTFGIGMPWEQLWTSLIIEHLRCLWGVPVRQFNLAWSGTGADHIAMTIHQSVEVLRPAAVFVLWSFTGRMTWFLDTRHQVHFIPEVIPPWCPKEHAAYLRLTTDAQGFFNYVRNFHLVNDRLRRLGIPFYWGMLERFSEAMLAPYVSLDGYAGDWRIVDFSRDGVHAGLRSHQLFASLMISALGRHGNRQAIQACGSLHPRTHPLASASDQVARSTSGGGIAAHLIRPLSGLVHQARLALRVRAMKRKDPFIY